MRCTVGVDPHDAGTAVAWRAGSRRRSRRPRCPSGSMTCGTSIRRSPSTIVVPSRWAIRTSSPRSRAPGRLRSTVSAAAEEGTGGSGALRAVTVSAAARASKVFIPVETQRVAHWLPPLLVRAPRRTTASLRHMILRMSSLFVRTLRDDPDDAEVPSHRLLVRAGYIRRAAPGIYTWLPLGLRVLRQASSGIIREEMDAIGAQELQLPGAAAQGALRGQRPLDRVRRQHLPAPGPQGRRLPARAHPRGDVHARREGPVLLVQGPAALDLPDPDQVPRRGASPRRPAARARVRDEGLLLLRRRRRRPRRVLPGPPRRLHPDLRPARLRVRHRLGPRRARWAARSPRSSSPRPTSARTPTSAARSCDYAANVEAVRVPRRPTPSRTTTRRPRTRRRPPTPRRSTPWSTTSTTRSPARTAPWAAADTLKNVLMMLSTPTAPASRSPSASPVTARSTRSGSRRRSTRPSSSRSARRTSPRTPRWSRATSARVRWARSRPSGSASSSTRASSRAPAG